MQRLSSKKCDTHTIAFEELIKLDTRLIEILANVQTIAVENVSDTRFLSILDTKLRQIKSQGYKIILLTDLNQDHLMPFKKSHR
jgi:hypothetical protein